MCHGEFESLKAIYAVSPGFVPKPYAWGEINNGKDDYFLLVEFCPFGRQVNFNPITIEPDARFETT